MLKFATKDPDRVFLGLSYDNLDRLRAEQPIRIGTRDCEMLGLGEIELIIIADESELKLAAGLEERGLLPEGTTDRAREELS